MANISGGKIYYTVHVDPKTLNAAIAALKALGAAAKMVNQNFKNGNAALSDWEFKSKELAAAIRTVNNDLAAGHIDMQTYQTRMSALENQANSMRTQFDAVSSSIVSTASDMQRAQDITSSLSNSMSITANATGGTKGAMEKLGAEFKTAQADVARLNDEIRGATKAFKAKTISANEYLQRLESLKVQMGAASRVIQSYAQAGTYSATEMRKLSLASASANNGLTQIAQGATMATGQLNRMATTTALARGSIALMNDALFKLSPTLGIFINYLSYATIGIKAFLAAAWPIAAIVLSIVAVVATFRAAAKAGIELETALTQVAKTTNLTKPELNELTNSFQELANEVPISTLEFLEFARVAGQLGITGVKNIQLFSEAIGKLSVATDVVGEEGATALARFLQATGVARENLGGFALQVGNILNELENTSAATAREILNMTSYTQGLASQAGASQAEILGLNAALLSLGVQAEAGGSAIVRIISKIQLAVADNGRALENFAVASQMTTEEFRQLASDSPIEALVALSDGLNQAANSGLDLNNVLVQLGIREVRERRTLLALAQGADTLKASIKTANDEALRMLSLNREVATMSDTVASRWSVLGARFKTIAQDLGTFLLPALDSLVEFLISATDGVIDLFGALGDLWNRLKLFLGIQNDTRSQIVQSNVAWRESRVAIENVMDALADLSQVSDASVSDFIKVMQGFVPTLDDVGRSNFSHLIDSLRDGAFATGDFTTALKELGLQFLEIGMAQATAAQVAAAATRDAARASLDAMSVTVNASRARVAASQDELQAYRDFLNALNIARDAQGRAVDGIFNSIELREALRNNQVLIDSLKLTASDIAEIFDQQFVPGSWITSVEAELRSLEAILAHSMRIIADFEANPEFLRLSDLITDAERNLISATGEVDKFTNAFNQFYQLGTFEEMIAFLEQFAASQLVLRFGLDFVDGEGRDIKDPADFLKELDASLREELRSATYDYHMRLQVQPQVMGFDIFNLTNEQMDAMELPLLQEWMNRTVSAYEGAIDEIVRMMFRLEEAGEDIPAEMYESLEDYTQAWEAYFLRAHQLGLDVASNTRAVDRIKAMTDIANELHESLRLIYEEGMLGGLGMEPLDVIERQANAYSQAIVSLLQSGFSAGNEMITRYASRWSELTGEVFNFEKAIQDAEDEAKKIADVDKVYADYAETLRLIEVRAREYGWSEKQRLEEIKAAITSTRDELIVLGQESTVRYSSVVNDLNRVDDALSRLDVASPLIAQMDAALEQSRRVILLMHQVADEADVTPEIQFEIDTAALGIMRSTIEDIIEEGADLEDVKLLSLVNDFNTLAESVGRTGAEIEAFATEREALAERVAYDNQLAQMELYFINLRTVANLSYAEALDVLAAQKLVLDERQSELLRSTYDLTEAQAALAVSTHEYERAVSVLALQVRLGLITEQEALTQQLKLAEEQLLLTALVYGENSTQAIAAREVVASLRGELDKITVSASTLAARLRLGLITETEFLRGRLSEVEAELGRLDVELDNAINSTDEYSDEVKELIDRINELRREQRDLNDALKEADFSRVASASGSYGAKVANAVGIVNLAFQDLADGNLNVGEAIGAVGMAFNGLVGTLETAEGQFVQSLTGMVGAIVEIFAPGYGQAIAAIGSFIATVFDFGSSLKKARKEVLAALDSVQLMSDETVKILAGLQGATKRVKSDGFLGWLGFKKTVMDEDFVNEIKSIFGQIAGVLSGSLSDALDASMAGEDWEFAFKQSFNEAILKVVKDTFIEATLLAAGFQTIMAEFTRRMKEEGPESAFEYLRSELPTVLSEAERAVSEFAENMPEFFLGDMWEATEENLNRIRDNILKASKVLTDGLVDTLIRLATTDGLVDEASLNALVSLAETIAGGFEQGLRSGIDSFLRGDQNWKDNLREGIKSTIVNSLIEAFIAGSAVQAIASDFVEGFINALQEGQKSARDWAAANIQDAVNGMAALIDEFVGAIPPELLPSSNPRSRDYRPPESEPGRAPEPRDAGTQISEITGPTRDLLVDLLTPLSILPSWTSMIRDIRNDLRSLVSGGGMIGSVALGVASASGVTTVQNQSIVINNPTINTQAKDARELYRELSTFAYKERKGGK